MLGLARLAAPVVALMLALPAWAQAEGEPPLAMVTAGDAPQIVDVDDAPAYYVTARRLEIRERPTNRSPSLATLQRRDGVRVLDPPRLPDDPPPLWRLVQYGDVRGYAPAEGLSNIWIRVDKSDRMVWVYRGSELLRELQADVSQSPEDKVRRSNLGESEHYRIPEGTFFVTRLHGQSEYYRAFVLSYPGPVHAQRGLDAGIISQATYDRILRADREALEPPMGTRLGGLIEIHGHGSGRQQAWPRGCVALRNVHMDELWEIVEVGTPVVIEP